jgi:NAD(P)-dependent dehydrogenase (short-subunit alcohol dehydrogenase family)
MFAMPDVVKPKGERIAVITGTSSGFGMLTAIELARKQVRVIATMRDPARSGELLQRAEQAQAADRIEVHRLDVTDPASIEQVVSEVLRAYGRIDILVNNAGYAVGGYVEDVTMDQWRQQMETNFFGLVAMTKSVIPAMRKQGSGLIINIGSISGRIGFPGYAPYSASKFAVEGFSECLRHELSPFGIRVVLVEPGAYRTPIWDKGLSQIPSFADSPYAQRMKAVMQISRKTAQTAPDPQQVADLIGMLIDQPSPRLRYPLGRGVRLSLLGKALMPWKWYERLIERGTRGDNIG